MILDAPRCLDVTRLARRAGRTLTGVDRVERAYLKRFLETSSDVFGLVRTKVGFLILDRAGLKIFDQLIDTGIWQKPDLLSRLVLRDPLQRKVETSLRRMAIARCRPGHLSVTLQRHLPRGVHYFNVGHSNITHKVLAAFASVPVSKTVVLIHDTIPLDFPEFQKVETPEKFRRQLKAVSGLADFVIANSQQTALDVQRCLSSFGHVPQIITAHLGVGLNRSGAAKMTVPKAPYFVTVGTIEPRKNHALLLDVWKQLAAEGDAPELHICGAKGWRNEHVLKELSRKPKGIKVHNALNDDDVLDLIEGATALLMPSFAEGFGIPLIEAAALGTPVVASDLPVYREFLKDIPVYLDPNDKYQWINTIKTLIVDPKARSAPAYSPPTWPAHFNKVLSRV